MKGTEFEIRRAQGEDATILSEIARAAKRHWGYPEEWMRLWRDDLTLTPEELSEKQVYCACNGEVVGFYALGLPGAAAGELELEHMWIAPTHMGMGLGRRLLDHARAQARQAGAQTLRIVSDPNAEGFYRKAGAQSVGQVASVPAGRLLPVMRLALG